MGAPVTTVAERRPHRHAAVSAGSGGDQDQAAVSGGRVRLLRDGLRLGNPRTYSTYAAGYSETVTCRTERKNAAGPAASRCS